MRSQYQAIERRVCGLTSIAVSSYRYRIEALGGDQGEIRGHDVCCRSTEGVEGEMKSVLPPFLFPSGESRGGGGSPQAAKTMTAPQ